MLPPSLCRSLVAAIALVSVTLLASTGHAAAPMSTNRGASLTIGATVVRSCAVGTATLPAFDAHNRDALIAASYASLKTTCVVEDAHIELGTSRVQVSAEGAAVLDVEF